MASIKEILSSYGSAARANYPQGDDVEYAMDYIVSFIRQHGYEFQDNLLDELRQGVGLCSMYLENLHLVRAVSSQSKKEIATFGMNADLRSSNGYYRVFQYSM